MAVLLLGYGGPGSLEEVEPFLNYLLGEISQRKPTGEQVKQTVARYERIGGSSPLLEITKEQAEALEEKLNFLGRDSKVYIGMRFWHPFIEEAVGKVVSNGVSELVVLSLSPFHSHLATGSYFKKTEEVLAKLATSPKTTFIKSWHNNPLLIEAFAEKIKAALASLFWGKNDTELIFSAHSLPKSADKNGSYVQQLEETKSAILKELEPISATLAYQSKGKTEEEWLQPELDTVLEKLTEEGKSKVLLIPLSFTADNIETLYDLDIVCRQKAETVGLNFYRVPCLNISPKLIDALAEVVFQCCARIENKIK